MMHHIPATRWCLIGLLLLMVVAQDPDAATLIVPDQFAGIQLAIDATQDGDTVLVRAGTYLEHITFVGKPISVISESGPAMTVIDASSVPDTSVVEMSGLTGASIEGFTITGGGGSANRGGGIKVWESTSTIVGAMIRANWIQGNEMDRGSGAGIWVGGAATIIGNRICNNVSLDGVGGGGIYADTFGGARVTIQGNEIFDNTVVEGLSRGGGILTFGGLFDISENIIACNWAHHGAGIKARGAPGETSVIENNTIVFNFLLDPELDEAGGAWITFSPGDIGQIAFRANSVFGNLGNNVQCGGSGPYDFQCNNVFPPLFPDGDPCEQLIGIDGNISSDPMLGGNLDCTCAGQPDPNDYCLQPGSPLLPENSPPGCDLIGARGECSPIGVRDAEVPSLQFQTLPARPNPFAERTTIPFFLAEDAEVEVWIYNVLGRRLRTLSPGWLLAGGEHTLVWDGRDDDGVRAASGAYVARIRAAGQELTRTLLLVR